MNDLTQMLMDAGFEYTSDLLANIHKFKKLIELEQEACAKVCAEKAAEWREEDMHTWPDGHRSSMGDPWYQNMAEGADYCAKAICAKGNQ